MTAPADRNAGQNPLPRRDLRARSVQALIAEAKAERARELARLAATALRWLAHAACASARAAARLGGIALAAAATCRKSLRAWRIRRIGRAELHALDDRLLKDIGLVRADIELVVRGVVDETRRSRNAPPSGAERRSTPSPAATHPAPSREPHARPAPPDAHGTPLQSFSSRKVARKECAG